MSDQIVVDVPDTWEQLTLGELCSRGGGDVQTGPFGSQLHASDYVAVGVPSVMPQNIGDNVIVEDGIARITHEDAERLGKYRLREGDIVYSRRGDVERRALVRVQQDGWLCGTGCLRVRAGASVDPRYLTYYLGHPEARSWIVRHAIGATMPNLNTKILSALPVVLPPNTEQAAIASLLGALDDKIAVNDRIAATCTELSIARFESSMAALRDSLEFHPLSDIVDHIPGKYLSRDEYQAGGLYTVYGSNSVMGSHTRYSHDGPITVMARIGSNCGALMWSPRSAWINNNASGLRARPGVNAWFAHHLIKIIDMGQHRAGSGQPFIRVESLLKQPVATPHPADQQAIGQVLMTVSEAAEARNLENRTLSDLRDTLLPKLISGELRIKDAEHVVSDAV